MDYKRWKIEIIHEIKRVIIKKVINEFWLLIIKDFYEFRV